VPVACQSASIETNIVISETDKRKADGPEAVGSFNPDKHAQRVTTPAAKDQVRMDCISKDAGRCNETLADSAFALAARGLPVFPVRLVRNIAGRIVKLPCIRRWNVDATTDPLEAVAMFDAAPDATLIGVLTGERSDITVVDIDPRNGGDIWEADHRAELAGTRVQWTGSRGRHYLFRYRPDVAGSCSGIAPGVDVKADNGFIVWWPQQGHATEGTLDDLGEMPIMLALAALGMGSVSRTGTATGRLEAPESADAVVSLLDAMPNDADINRSVYEHVALACVGCWRSVGGDDDADDIRDAFIRWAEKYPGAGDEAAKWDSDWSIRTNDVSGWPHLLSLAKTLGVDTQPWLTAAAAAQFAQAPLPRPAAAPAAVTEPATTNSDHCAVSESEISDEFTEIHGSKCRWDVNCGAWFIWTGTHWRRDEGSLAFHWAKKLIRNHVGGMDPKARIAPGRAAFAGGVERFARADPALMATAETWDRDPWLLGSPGGTVDLHTGRLGPARREDYITRQTAVAPAPAGTAHPVWSRFLGEATRGDVALQRFMQQVSGYCLTGVTREHALFFVYGPGGNGKSVFLDVLRGIMGEYATVASMDAFTVSYGDKHSTDLAALAGARLVTASETEEGRQWAESRIKSLTGGDPITARFMRQDNFTYLPQFKLLIVGNHQPALRNIDEAARRRFNIIPFMHQPVAKNDRLTDELKSEWPAILRWAIDGCQNWQSNGLARPKVVLDATNEYMDSQNLVRRWIEDHCEMGKLCTDTSSNLFRAWQYYAAAAGERPGTAKWFSQVLQREGCVPVRIGAVQARGFGGIRLKPSESAKPADIPNGTDASDSTN